MCHGPFCGDGGGGVYGCVCVGLGVCGAKSGEGMGSVAGSVSLLVQLFFTTLAAYPSHPVHRQAHLGVGGRAAGCSNTSFFFFSCGCVWLPTPAVGTTQGELVAWYLGQLHLASLEDLAVERVVVNQVRGVTYTCASLLATPPPPAACPPSSCVPCTGCVGGAGLCRAVCRLRMASGCDGVPVRGKRETGGMGRG